MQLWREVRAKGYSGSASSVRPYLALLRQAPHELLPPGSPKKKQPASKQDENAFSVRRLIWLVLSRPEQLTPEQAQEVTRVSTLHPDITLAFKLAQTFAKMLRDQSVEALPLWLTSAQASSLPEFAQLAKSGLSEIGRQWKPHSAAQKATTKPKAKSINSSVSKDKCMDEPSLIYSANGCCSVDELSRKVSQTRK